MITGKIQMSDRFRPKLTNSVIFLVITVVSLIYWVADRYIEVYSLNDLLDGPLMVISFVVFTAYSAGLLADFNKSTDSLYVIKVGIALSWLANGVWRVSRFLYAEGIFGKAAIGVHDSWRGYMICLMVLAGVFHIVAIDMDAEGAFSRRYVYLAAASVTTGFVFVAVFKIFLSGLVVLR